MFKQNIFGTFNRIGFHKVNGGLRNNISLTKLHYPSIKLMNSMRLYSSSPSPIPTRKKEPRIRYLFYMFILSSVAVYFVSNRVNKKKVQSSFSEREFDEYEQTTGIKRRTKLITPAQGEKYKFYGVPFTSSDELIEGLTQQLQKHGSKVKIIDIHQLLDREITDESRKYCYLLQDLKSSNKPFPKGLVTALIKEEIHFYINTSQGIYDTNFIFKNYPQTTTEASKFENDVGYLEQVIALKKDMDNLDQWKDPDDVRLINNVVSYFETVGRSMILSSVDEELN